MNEQNKHRPHAEPMIFVKCRSGFKLLIKKSQYRAWLISEAALSAEQVENERKAFSYFGVVA